jgi:hypothetical protein
MVSKKENVFLWVSSGGAASLWKTNMSIESILTS